MIQSEYVLQGEGVLTFDKMLKSGKQIQRYKQFMHLMWGDRLWEGQKHGGSVWKDEPNHFHQTRNTTVVPRNLNSNWRSVVRVTTAPVTLPVEV